VQVFGDSYYRFKKKHEQGEELARQEINREKLSEKIKQSHILNKLLSIWPINILLMVNIKDQPIFYQKDILMSEDGIHSVWRRCDLF
jgi:hypothetical protein